ncbi:ATP-binding protein [Marinomonas ostreistagni]|uniref:ATP-binding protein n=1 Tax=Marinomonas ostreistagni TaxID=359209 RepID=UPI00194F275D|nr:ATP-binding protein [Marinomonas ostreistagni]MBM6551299.1 two-component sensor histidine kinase [Marinomonas ostreistagni]
MSSDMWRLYRHILIGGVIILLACYAVIESLQERDRHKQQVAFLNLDAELSAQLLASDVPLEAVNLRSRFDWQVLAPLSANHSKYEFRISDPRATPNVTVYDGDEIVLKGLGKEAHGYSIAGLLRYFLDSDASNEAKLDFVETVSGARFEPVSPELWSTADVKATELIRTKEGMLALLWRPQGSEAEQAWLITMKPKTGLSLSLAAMLTMLVAITALLALVWYELVGLDKKRVHFETATRQIARGRGSLPQGVEDSSGTLKELAYSFDSMSTHIQRLLKVQREMINAISHELRTPIARLRFGLEVLKDEVTPDQESSISALEVDVEELNTLVDEVLTYGKLEEGSLALNFEKTSIEQLLNDIVDHNQSLLQKLTVTIETSGDDIVNADAHHLHRALQNLILNASKYANDAIKISFFADDERWQVDIEDDGPGIPAEDRDKVFIPFQRLDNSRTRASGGYGLGLAIVQRIAFWHGGAVLVEESSLGGAKFSFIWSRSQHQNQLG